MPVDTKLLASCAKGMHHLKKQKISLRDLLVAVPVKFPILSALTTCLYKKMLLPGSLLYLPSVRQTCHCQLIDLQIWLPYQNSFPNFLAVIFTSLKITWCTQPKQWMLSICGRSNVLYKLSKGIGTLRPDNSDSCFPCKQMPMGMLEYMADFFASMVVQQVHRVHSVFSHTLNR